MVVKIHWLVSDDIEKSFKNVCPECETKVHGVMYLLFESLESVDDTIIAITSTSTQIRDRVKGTDQIYLFEYY